MCYFIQISTVDSSNQGQNWTIAKIAIIGIDQNSQKQVNGQTQI